MITITVNWLKEKAAKWHAELTQVEIALAAIMNEAGTAPRVETWRYAELLDRKLLAESALHSQEHYLWLDARFDELLAAIKELKESR